MQVQQLKYEKAKKKSKGLGPAPETLYRVTLRNQLRNIGIADQKAKILLGINTILISIFIATSGIVSNIEELQFITQLKLHVPFLSILITCFISGAIAVVAVKPNAHIWKKNNPSKLSFRDFKGVSLDDFLDDMDQIMASRKSIYKSLNTDLYLLGRCLQSKNQLLKYAYNIFLVGLTVGVISFIYMRWNIPAGVV